jgi:hypothetical protein
MLASLASAGVTGGASPALAIAVALLALLTLLAMTGAFFFVGSFVDWSHGKVTVNLCIHIMVWCNT